MERSPWLQRKVPVRVDVRPRRRARRRADARPRRSAASSDAVIRTRRPALAPAFFLSGGLRRQSRRARRAAQSGQIRRAEVAEELQVGRWVQVRRRLVLDHDFLADDHVQGLSGQRLSAVVDHHRNLAIDAMTLGDKIPLEGQSVDVFAVPEPELTVYVTKRVENRSRQISLQKRLALAVHWPKMSASPLACITESCRRAANDSARRLQSR